jgi:hypothetical protein
MLDLIKDIFGTQRKIEQFDLMNYKRGDNSFENILI